MFAVQDDWIQYEGVPARRPAVRGGAACAHRLPVVRSSLRPVLTAVPRPVAVRPARSRPLRLTRRGRLVLVVLPGILAISGAVAAVAGADGTRALPPAPEAGTVLVGSGDTLWSIAERVSPTADPRQVVADLERENGLDGARVPAGTVLRLPAGR